MKPSKNEASKSEGPNTRLNGPLKLLLLPVTLPHTLLVKLPQRIVNGKRIVRIPAATQTNSVKRRRKESRKEKHRDKPQSEYRRGTNSKLKWLSDPKLNPAIAVSLPPEFRFGITAARLAKGPRTFLLGHPRAGEQLQAGDYVDNAKLLTQGAANLATAALQRLDGSSQDQGAQTSESVGRVRTGVAAIERNVLGLYYRPGLEDEFARHAARLKAMEDLAPPAKRQQRKLRNWQLDPLEWRSRFDSAPVELETVTMPWGDVDVLRPALPRGFGGWDGAFQEALIAARIFADNVQITTSETLLEDRMDQSVEAQVTKLQEARALLLDELVANVQSPGQRHTSETENKRAQRVEQINEAIEQLQQTKQDKYLKIWETSQVRAPVVLAQLRGGIAAANATVATDSGFNEQGIGGLPARLGYVVIGPSFSRKSGAIESIFNQADITTLGVTAREREAWTLASATAGRSLVIDKATEENLKRGYGDSSPKQYLTDFYNDIGPKLLGIDILNGEASRLLGPSGETEADELVQLWDSIIERSRDHGSGDANLENLRRRSTSIRSFIIRFAVARALRQAEAGEQLIVGRPVHSAPTGDGDDVVLERTFEGLEYRHLAHAEMPRQRPSSQSDTTADIQKDEDGRVVEDVVARPSKFDPLKQALLLAEIFSQEPSIETQEYLQEVCDLYRDEVADYRKRVALRTAEMSDPSTPLFAERQRRIDDAGDKAAVKFDELWKDPEPFYKRTLAHERTLDPDCDEQEVRENTALHIADMRQNHIDDQRNDAAIEFDRQNSVEPLGFPESWAELDAKSASPALMLEVVTHRECELLRLASGTFGNISPFTGKPFSFDYNQCAAELNQRLVGVSKSLGRDATAQGEGIYTFVIGEMKDLLKEMKPYQAFGKNALSFDTMLEMASHPRRIFLQMPNDTSHVVSVAAQVLWTRNAGRLEELEKNRLENAANRGGAYSIESQASMVIDAQLPAGFSTLCSDGIEVTSEMELAGWRSFECQLLGVAYHEPLDGNPDLARGFTRMGSALLQAVAATSHAALVGIHPTFAGTVEDSVRLYLEPNKTLGAEIAQTSPFRKAMGQAARWNGMVGAGEQYGPERPVTFQSWFTTKDHPYRLGEFVVVRRNHFPDVVSALSPSTTPDWSEQKPSLGQRCVAPSSVAGTEGKKREGIEPRPGHLYHDVGSGKRKLSQMAVIMGSTQSPGADDAAAMQRLSPCSVGSPDNGYYVGNVMLTPNTFASRRSRVGSADEINQRVVPAADGYLSSPKRNEKAAEVHARGLPAHARGRMGRPDVTNLAQCARAVGDHARRTVEDGDRIVDLATLHKQRAQELKAQRRSEVNAAHTAPAIAQGQREPEVASKQVAREDLRALAPRAFSRRRTQSPEVSPGSSAQLPHTAEPVDRKRGTAAAKTTVSNDAAPTKMPDQTQVADNTIGPGRSVDSQSPRQAEGPRGSMGTHPPVQTADADVRRGKGAAWVSRSEPKPPAAERAPVEPKTAQPKTTEKVSENGARAGRAGWESRRDRETVKPSVQNGGRAESRAGRRAERTSASALEAVPSSDVSPNNTDQSVPNAEKPAATRPRTVAELAAERGMEPRTRGL